MTNSAAKAALNKKLIRETIAGYAVAAEYIEQEKIAWLQGMTPEESWATFEELVEFGRHIQGDPMTLQVFEPRRIEHHVFMRQVFERLARAKGLI